MKRPVIYKKFFLLIFTIVITLVVTALRYYFGAELAFTLFYIFPVIFATWFTGIWSGILISFFNAALWLTADLSGTKFSTDIIPYLNNTFRLIVFLIITYIVSELKRALEKQIELARIDPLTSIANRRAFYETASLEVDKASRHKFPVSILYVDLDNFKEVNDTFGHSTGDMLLKLIAAAISKSLRTIDLAGRLGGDEFGILLTQTNAESAFIVASKLKEIITELMQKNNWPVTPSIGIVTSSASNCSLNEIMKKADMLMYTAKQSGKNTIRQAVIS